MFSFLVVHKKDCECPKCFDKARLEVDKAKKATGLATGQVLKITDEMIKNRAVAR